MADCSMEEMAETRSSRSGTDSTEEQQQREEQENNVLRFLDSTDSYLNLIDSLSSALRRGWLELASARHSMGASRINGALLDLKYHSAATTVEVNHHDAGSIAKSTQFTLCKWSSPDNKKFHFGEVKFEEDELLKRKSDSPQLRHRGAPQNSEYKENTLESTGSESNGSPHMIDNSVQKERSKLLSMFGTLVSPKLRASQLSFETALETLVEIANMRSSMLGAHDQVRKEMESTMG